MRRLALALAITTVALAPAMAQQAPMETVIVTASKYHFGVTPNAIAHDFVGSIAMPSVLTDQISRWETGVCPRFDGVAPQFAAVMEYHFRTIAAEAGAPLKEKGCKPNLMVLFSSQPQAQLEAVRAKQPGALGYRAAAVVAHPIQAWYASGTRDLYGQIFMDQDPTFILDPGTCIPPCPHAASTTTTPFTNVGGWRDHPDVTSDLLYVTIIVDSSRTAKYQVGEIADYVAMLALSRTEDYGDCQLMPSITNLLSPNCDDKLKPDRITRTDIAFLRGVYKMDPGAKLQIQQDQIAGEMAKSLGAGK